MNSNIVAIVGRPNVGKSTLFNRLAKKRSAIVDYTEGVTRDRKYEEVEWLGKTFTLVDTGGIIIDTDDKIDKMVRYQAEIAIEEADLILFLVDARVGTTDVDIKIANILRKRQNDVMLIANKSDNEKIELEVYDFLQLGFGDAFPVAAAGGRNTGKLLDEVMNRIKPIPVSDDVEDTIKVAIVGKPNVGKSSIVNRLIGEDTAIVSEIPGTTRDSIDSVIRYKKQKITFIDTAGLRRKSKIKYGLEYFSSIRSIHSVKRSDIVILVIDSYEGITNQDQKIADLCARYYRPIIIVYNKWDLIKKDNSTTIQFEKKAREILRFVDYSPIMFVSALTNQRIHKILEMILTIDKESKNRISTSKLNKFLEKVIRKFPPSHSSGKHVKIYYCTQQAVKPPHFIFFMNNAEYMTKRYKRYLHNQLREYFKFTGVTIKLSFRSRKGEGEEDVVFDS